MLHCNKFYDAALAKMFVWGFEESRPVSSASMRIAVGAEGLDFDCRVGQIGCSVAIAAMFFRSCVAQALSHKNEPRHSLHACVVPRV